ncbi:helix-turn-helix domain-containing protein [Enterobacteriaceae bacterium H11S18]|uniref:helix-turn-helix domain-containing protein n=1 Tax=Dryocola clanedunensis TaxID=2925396 RepID=UPI0022F01B7D|nr:helix-turn-helix domain-containing protein [Dryocola clanedunensis]MCT4707767.1 helix-turn-helix domain-containing protein [Dryocola clanedunensis]MCT4711155.1 helix-turn-helix domain-containing protein [Dryocola clanedunensis]
MQKDADYGFSDNDDFNELIDFIKIHGRQRRYSKGESLDLVDTEAGFVIDGRVGVYFKKNDKFIDYAFYGMPIMEYEKMQAKHPFYYRIESDVIIVKLPIAKLFDPSIVQKSNNGLAFISVIYSIIERLSAAFEVRHGGNGYSAIKELIELYQQEEKVSQGLASYILKRTCLSNGYVFRILAILKERNYIEMEQGRLKKIMHPLPDKI